LLRCSIFEIGFDVTSRLKSRICRSSQPQISYCNDRHSNLLFEVKKKTESMQNDTPMTITHVPIEVQPVERLPACGQFEDPVNSLPNLNNSGVYHLENSEFNQAIDNFQRALQLLGRRYDPLKIVSLGCQKALSGDATCHNKPCGCGVSTDSYIYQRREYDEGMHHFSTPIRMEGSLLDSIRTHEDAAAVVFYNVGQLCLLRHRDEAATECFIRALFLARSSAGMPPVSVVAILHNIGYIQYRNIELEKALATFNECLQVCRCVSDKLEYAATLNCLGVLSFHLPKADTTNAMENYTNVLSIRRQMYGNDHKDVGTTLNNIGRVHYIKGEYDLALANYLEALRIRRSLLGKDHLDVAATVYNAGQTFHQKGDLSKALKYYKEFMRITVPKLGQNHRDVAIMLKCMAQIYHEQREYEKALTLYSEALTVGRAALGMHAEVASILNKMGNLFYERGDFDAALKKYQDGLDVERAVLHSLHPNITVTLTNIGQIHKQRGEYSEALRL
jgi:tetratricopeptide (TPR) repeat protein